MYTEAQHIKDTNFIDLKVNLQKKALEKIRALGYLFRFLKHSVIGKAVIFSIWC